MEIEPPERLVHEIASKANDPRAFVSTVTFAEHGASTRIMMRSLFRTKEQRDEVVVHFTAVEGAEQTLGKLAAYVERLISNDG